MIVLIGIVSTYLLVILRAKQSIQGSVPYATVFFLTVLLVAFVVAMMFTMESPE